MSAGVGSHKLGRGFWALFTTQFLGAFNDNLFKTTLTVSITFEAVQLAGLDSTGLVALSGALLILPFALFSALAGQLADRADDHVRDHAQRLTVRLTPVVLGEVKRLTEDHARPQL